MSRYLDNKGRLVLPETRQKIAAMSDDQVREFRDHYVGSYASLVQAADEEIERRKGK